MSFLHLPEGFPDIELEYAGPVEWMRGVPFVEFYPIKGFI